MPKSLTEPEKCFIQQNAAKMTATEIAKHIPGFGPKSVAKYIEENVKPVEVDQNLENGIMGSVESGFSRSEVFYMEENYRRGVEVEKIAKDLRLSVEEVRAYVANFMPTVGGSFIQKTSENEHTGVSIMTKAASAHDDTMKFAGKNTGKPDLSDRIHKINSSRVSSTKSIVGK